MPDTYSWNIRHTQLADDKLKVVFYLSDSNILFYVKISKEEEYFTIKNHLLKIIPKMAEIHYLDEPRIGLSCANKDLLKTDPFSIQWVKPSRHNLNYWANCTGYTLQPESIENAYSFDYSVEDIIKQEIKSVNRNITNYFLRKYTDSPKDKLIKEIWKI